jgi:hypothetical protein
MKKSSNLGGRSMKQEQTERRSSFIPKNYLSIGKGAGAAAVYSVEGKPVAVGAGKIASEYDLASRDKELEVKF